MPPAGFEPAIPASERPQTHALDRAATGIGRGVLVFIIIMYNVYYFNFGLSLIEGYIVLVIFCRVRSCENFVCLCLCVYLSYFICTSVKFAIGQGC